MLQRVADKPLTICPKCGGELEKLISPAAIHFKGSGWYITDYARQNKGNGQESHGYGKGKEAGSGQEGSKASDSAKPNASKPAPHK